MSREEKGRLRQEIEAKPQPTPTVLPPGYAEGAEPCTVVGGAETYDMEV